MLTIGDFSRMTQLSVKTLRHYHDVGLLAPHHVDPATGYRYYTVDQVPTAQVVRRLRALDMPVPEVRSVLDAELEDRNTLISTHLGRLETRLAATQAAVEALRDILDRPSAPPRLTHRNVAATPSLAVHAIVDREDLIAWWQGAVDEVRSELYEQRLTQAGPPGTLFGFDVFANDRGPVTVFIPTNGSVRPSGRVAEFAVPAAELVVIRHHGPHDDVDLAYSELGEYATRHELSVEAPLREYYERFSWDTEDSSQWVTDLCWPVFRSDATEAAT